MVLLTRNELKEPAGHAPPSPPNELVTAVPRGGGGVRPGNQFDAVADHQSQEAWWAEIRCQIRAVAAHGMIKPENVGW